MRKRIAIGLLAAAVVVGLVAVSRHELLRFAIRAAAAFAGYDVSIGQLQVGRDGATLRELRVERSLEPLLQADRVTIRYSLRDLLPGSRHRFGLTGVEVSGVKLTLSRSRSGAFNIAFPGATAPAAPAPQRIDSVPLRFLLKVRDARIELREPSAYDQSAVDVHINRIGVDASIDTSAITHYRVAGAFEERREEPFTVVGKIDAIAGFAMHHAKAARFPVRALANYFAQTPDVRILHGGARNFDAVLYALDVQPNVAPSYHVSLRLDIDGGRLGLSVLSLPIENIGGTLHVVDNAFFISNARATLAGIPLHIRGGVYDLNGAVTGSPQLRLGVWGAGDLADLREAFGFTRDQPISGKATLGVLVAGPIGDPVIVARANAGRALYRNLPFDRIAASVVYHANVVALAPLRASYGGISLEARGTLHTGAHLRSRFAVHVAGPANRLPYLDEMLGDEPIVIDAGATGDDLLFHVIGSVASARGVERVAAILRMDENGTALVDPFWVHTPRGDLDGSYLLDRPHNTSAFWLLSDDLRMRAPAYPAFPNLNLPQMPKIDGGTVRAAIAGGGSGNHILLAGLVSGAETSIAGVRFTSLEATLAGTMQHAPINRLRASGPWGTFRGRGEFSTQGFVAYGDYRGSFEGLAPFLGSAIAGHGRLGGTVAIAVEPKRIVVVGSNLSMPGATLRGVPVDRASLTLAVEGDRLRIYSAHASAAGGDVVAAGTLSLAPQRAGTSSSNALALVADRLRSSQLRGIGLPLAGGTIYADGELRAGAALPAFAGGVTINNSRIAQFPIAGEADVNLSGDAVALRRMVGQIGGAYARADGTIGALLSGSPTYAIRANLPAAQVARTLRAFDLPNYMTDGSFNAQLLVGGRSVSPTIAGTVGVPAGVVNGLPFVDGRAAIDADRTGVSISGGSVLVGTTAARFDAVVRPHNVAGHVDARSADLSDFNNFFDTGDTLAGKGGVSIATASRGTRTTSSGNINIRGFRYRSLPIGDTRAVWSSERNVVAGALAIGGSEGELHARGSVGLAPPGPWLSTLERSRFDLAADVGNLDLSLWLPALGMQAVPITGRASGQATVRGSFPQIDVRGNARIIGGTLGPLTLDSADVAVHAARGRIVIDRAEMTTPELSASATGSLGLAPQQPVDLHVYAATNHLATLIYDASRRRVPITGSFESTLSVGGTYQEPTFLAGFDATSVLAYGIPISSLFGEVRLRGHQLVLSDAGVTFQRGEATLAGALPLSTQPLRIAAPNSALSFDLDVVGLDPSIFDEALGSNTKLQGLLDGHIGLSGTVAQPIVVGRVSLARGSYVSDLERTPLTQIVADLSFNHASASIDRVSAKAGNGSLNGSGSVEFPSGLSRAGLSLAIHGTARRAQLNLPAYGSGTLDAQLALLKRPGTVALLSGNATLSDAALPFASFIKAATQSSSAGVAIPLAFDVSATAGKNVRVRGSGYGAGLDIGATGSVRLGGTLAAPTLAGAFESTGGTLTYFDRAFRVQQANVHFNAADGVLPALHAVATTSVVNPDPDRARNPYGSAEVTITVDGPIAGLKIGLESNPAGYTRDQILGLIAPFGGFFSGISFSRQSMLARQQPNGITPLGTLSPIPSVALPQNSSITVGQEAFNILNAQFTAGLLAPVENTLGQGLGLSSVNLTLGYYGNVGVTASRLLGKAVSAVYAVTFGIPQVQSFGLVVQPGPTTAAALNFFYQSGPTKLLQLPGAPVGYSGGYLTGQPLIGNTGFSLTLQHYFW